MIKRSLAGGSPDAVPVRLRTRGRAQAFEAALLWFYRRKGCRTCTRYFTILMHFRGGRADGYISRHCLASGEGATRWMQQMESGCIGEVGSGKELVGRTNGNVVCRRDIVIVA